MHILKMLALCIFAICLPLLLISSNIRFIISEPYIYGYGFNKYDISEVTGINDDQLEKAAKDLRHYFNTGGESAQIQVMRGDQQIDLFNQKELYHLEDVKDIVQLFYLIQWITLAYVIVFIICGFVIQKRAFLTKLMQELVLGAISTLALFAFVGIWALVDFDSLFLTFHHTSFSNDFWILDPSKDFLIMMFPEEFFMDAAMFLVVGTLIEAVVMGGIAFLFLRRQTGAWQFNYRWHSY